MRCAFERLESRLLLSTYAVGPGHPYANLRDVPWDAVGPGDTVLVYWQPTPYHDKIALPMSGTASAHVQILGVPGPAGELPVIDANGAVENPQAAYFTDQIAYQGIFTVAPTGYEGPDYKTRYIDIANFELENALRDSYFITAAGDVAWYNWGAAAVAMYNAEHITLTNLTVHDNENGLFGKSNGYEAGNLRDITVQNCTIFNNGVPGEDHYHNTYIEAIGTTYQFNYFGPPKEGSQGNNVKDRSAGLIFRYNYVTGGIRLLDLVEPDDGGQSMVEDPLFGNTYVYGNVLRNNGTAATFVHFGGDTGIGFQYQHNLYFYDNTVVNVMDQATLYRTILFDLDTNHQTAYVDNNILYDMPQTQGAKASNWCIAEIYGHFYLGTNWINAGYYVNRDNYPFEGTMDGQQYLITGDDPSFVDVVNGDYRLNPDSAAIGVADQGQTGVYYCPLPVEYQLDCTSSTFAWTARASAADVGAVESVPTELVAAFGADARHRARQGQAPVADGALWARA